MTEVSTDFCVIGGGPAGLSLALLLLRSGARVTVAERSGSLERAYRGEILQPGGQAVLAPLGVLDGIVARGTCPLDGFQLLQGTRALMDIDYGRLDPPHNTLLSVPQRHVLAELLAHCERYLGFRYLAGHRVRDLVMDGTRVTGAEVTGPSETVVVQSRCVVGADGRYSKVRKLAGIEAGRADVFDQDVLWFKLEAAGRMAGRVRIFRASTGAVLVHDSYPDRLQIGWTLPHGGYRTLAEQGVEQVKAQLCAAVPRYADLIDEQLTSLRELTLLDVFGGCAPQWERDGLVLLGDAAHTHGPLGAQGINLAVQDAALLHPVLLNALRHDDFGALRLADFRRQRQPDIDRVMKVQQMQSKGMLGRHGLGDLVRPVAARLIQHTPIGAKITRRIAFGNPAIEVRTDLFASD
ncbi:FAD-dependent monooxygenase [Streptomyces rimosus]|uniref:FAD-dependent monooxygenase n=1 Tax=Streptomyces rimosus TaxID=1927 RepID=UPI0004C10FCD|nr:FAD-dependent monooxygenase [Streptomyces rimosus]